MGDLMKIRKNIFHAKHDDTKTVTKHKLQLKGTKEFLIINSLIKTH